MNGMHETLMLICIVCPTICGNGPLHGSSVKRCHWDNRNRPLSNDRRLSTCVVFVIRKFRTFVSNVRDLANRGRSADAPDPKGCVGGRGKTPKPQIVHMKKY